MTRALFSLLPSEDGQGLAEYALILVLLVLTAVAATTTFTSSLGSLYARASNGMTAATEHRPLTRGLYGSFPSIQTKGLKRNKGWGIRAKAFTAGNTK